MSTSTRGGVGIGPQGLQRLNAVHAGHTEVEQHHLGPMPLHECEGLLPIPGRANHIETLLGAQHAGEAGTDDRMVINDKNTDFAVRFFAHYRNPSIGRS